MTAVTRHSQRPQIGREESPPRKETLRRYASQSDKRLLPEGWTRVSLDEVCQPSTGIRDPRSEPDKPFRYVDISGVDNVSKQIVASRVILGKQAPSRARQVIKSGDVIVSTTRPNLNAVAVVPPDLDDQICSTGFCVLRPKENLDRDFLFAFVQTTEFVESLSSLVKGALYPAVTDKQVRSQVIPLPPLSEQRRIAGILQDQLAAVDRARAAAEEQLEAAQALPAAYLRAVFNSPEAQQWPQRTVAELCERIDYGYTASANFAVTEPRFLRITDIQDGAVNWANVPGCVINPKEEMANRLEDGDIVFARTGATTGKSFLIRQPPRAVFASYLIRLRPTGAVRSTYLYAFFQSDSYWKQIRASARGGIQPNVNATLLGAIRLPLPPLVAQQRIAALLSEQMAAAEQARQALQAQLDTINRLPAVLLRRAFNGEL